MCLFFFSVNAFFVEELRIAILRRFQSYNKNSIPFHLPQRSLPPRPNFYSYFYTHAKLKYMRLKKNVVCTKLYYNNRKFKQSNPCLYWFNLECKRFSYWNIFDPVLLKNVSFIACNRHYDVPLPNSYGTLK